MAKFKVLKYNQLYIQISGFIHSTDNLNDPPKNLFKLLSTYLILFVIFAFFELSSFLFFYKHFDQFDAALETIYIMIAGVQICGMYLSVGLKMDKVISLHIKLLNIVEGIVYDNNNVFQEKN